MAFPSPLATRATNPPFRAAASNSVKIKADPDIDSTVQTQMWGKNRGWYIWIRWDLASRMICVPRKGGQMRLSHSLTLGFLSGWNVPTVGWAKHSIHNGPPNHQFPIVPPWQTPGTLYTSFVSFPRSCLHVSSIKHHEPIVHHLIYAAKSMLCSRWTILEPVFPECVARVPVSLWGSGGWGYVTMFARRCPTVRNRPPPFAAVRNRSRDPCMAVPMVSSAEGVIFGGFKRRVASFRVAGVALRDIQTCFCKVSTQYFCDFRKMSCSFRALWTCPSSFCVAGAAL